MHAVGIIGFVILIVTFLVSYKGFTDHAFFVRYSFQVDRVLVYKEYKRLVTSGFLHVGWLHLIFNMVTLNAFSSGVEAYLGPFSYLVIYIASLVGGNLFALLVHRNHGDYSGVGASGAVCGVIFAGMALFPGMDIAPFGLIAIPGWLYAIVFVLVSIYGIKSKSDNIGHEAHLGGALVGMLVAIIMRPSSLVDNYITILLILVPTVAFIFVIIRKPHFLLVDNFFYKTHPRYTVDDRYNLERNNRQQEIDRILEKIHKRGMSSLTKREKDMLNEYSRMK
jgi:membrane associated rhomboid family serine protease